MAVITLTSAQLAFGHVQLLDHADFSLEQGERIGLIGRNGTGKSSLLRILAGIDRPDDGVMHVQSGVRTAYVEQEPQLNELGTVFDEVAEGLRHIRNLIEQATDGAGDIDRLHGEIEAEDGWNWAQRVNTCLARFELSADTPVSTLSGGGRKRVSLARAVVQRPNVLFLDEPTNHLDIDAIGWLEEVAKSFEGSMVVITHDRHFLDRVATRIVELDRGKLQSYPGSFSEYQARKESSLAQEEVIAAKADKLLAQEEVWVRQGVEARRTRSQSRIGRLEQLRAARAARREALGSVKLELGQGDRSGKIVAELCQVSKSFGEKVIVRDFSGIILRGAKLGIVGPNGVGKTTLLKLILGELAPDQGAVRQGTRLQVAYFDQMRDQIDLDATLEDFISPGSEWIEIGDTRKHVKSYLGDFLFPAARAQAPVRTLSGGERSRLLMARLFAKPANVLVMDEPTNDLDIATQELLEELLSNYPGTVFLVSHDRSFVDNVVTSTLAWEGPGNWVEYEGGISDWLTQSARRRALLASSPDAPARPAPTNVRGANEEKAGVPAKLSYKEKRELESLPGLIESMEAEQSALRLELQNPDIYARDAKRAETLHVRDGEIEEALLAALERWEALSSRPS